MNLSDVLFPQICAGCGSLGTQICVRCSHLMRPIQRNWCLSCGNILRKTTHCVHCEGKKDTLPILGCWYYESIISRAVWSLKYKGNKRVALELSSRIHPRTISEIFVLKEKHKDMIFVPVPLHETREKERGYNQSQIFAQLLGAITDIPVANNALERMKITKPQAKCQSRRERAQNIQGAFLVKEQGLLQGKAIILVDDVVTTGATVREVAREIKKEHLTTVLGAVCLAREQEGVIEK